MQWKSEWLVSDSPPCYPFSGRPHANCIGEMDWRAEIRGHGPVGTPDNHRFRPRVQQSTRADGIAAVSVGVLHGHGRGNHPRKETPKARVARSDLFRRAGGEATHGLDQAGNTLSPPGPSR